MEPQHDTEVPMAERSAHQQRIIRNYYDNKDSIMLQKLGDMVADLYLAEGKKRTTLWQRAAKALVQLGVNQKQVDHIVASDNPSILAKHLETLLAKK